MLSKPDLIISGILLLSVFIGIVRGFIKESISLVTWVFAIGAGVVYFNPLSEYMTFTKMDFVRNLSAFLLIFVGIVFVGAVMNYFIGGAIRKTPFSIPDRVLGSAFGALRGIAVITVMILIGGLTSLPEESWWRDSYTIKHFQELSIWLKDRLPDETAKVFHLSQEDEANSLTKGSK